MNKFIIMQIKEELRDEHKYGWIREFYKKMPDHGSPIKCGHDDIGLKKVQEQVTSKSFTKMCFSTNAQEEKRCNLETGYSYAIKQHDRLTNILYKDALFNRFIAKCVNNSKIEETTLIEMFAEFLTMMSDCENRNIETKSHSQGWERLKDLNNLKFVMCEDIGEELRQSSKSFSEFLQKLRKKIQNISKQDEQTFKNKEIENFQLSCIINSLSLEDRDELLDCFVRSYVFRE